MGIKDLFVTPIYIMVLSLLAYIIRPYVTTPENRKYFMPALWVRFVGAIALGLIYQFYYGGGDTFNYTIHGSHWIWEAFIQSPVDGLRLLLTSGGEHFLETFEFSSKIWYYRDPSSYVVVRIAAFFDLFTFRTYGATTLFFAAISFSGLWAMFKVLEEMYPGRSRLIALAIFFVPSSIFWGSGILKDTITLGSLGWLTYAMINLVHFRRRIRFNVVLAVIAGYLISEIKLYILICFLPTVFFWMYLQNVQRIRSLALKAFVAPVLLIAFTSLGYFAMDQVSSSSQKYSLDQLAYQAAVTAYDIRYGWGARTEGDGGYDIGLPDGTWQGMVRLMPPAVNVTLFRPYIWEVKNPLMLLTALEALVFMLLTIRLVYTGNWRAVFSDPFLTFSLLFSILFAFAVGVSTFNFGTLMRYKIPMIPFYCLVLVLSYRKLALGKTIKLY